MCVTEGIGRYFQNPCHRLKNFTKHDLIDVIVHDKNAKAGINRYVSNPRYGLDAALDLVYESALLFQPLDLESDPAWNHGGSELHPLSRLQFRFKIRR